MIKNKLLNNNINNKKMSSVCEICDNNLNQTIRKSVSCPYCEFTACRTCCETYILGETTSKCMNPPCNREWTRQFIAKAFTDVFLSKKLKKKREEILFDIERSLLPATQPIVERIIRREKNPKEYNKVRQQIRHLEIKLSFLSYSPKIGTYSAVENFKCAISKDKPEYWEALNIWQQNQKTQTEMDIRKQNKQNKQNKQKYNELTEKIKQLNDKKNELELEHKTLYDYNKQPEQRQRAEFIRACPDNDCRGFLSTQWKCGLCEKWSCPQCHEIKGLNRDVEHTCNPDILASARLISNDTRPCPSCGSGIFKIAGCDHMWCTQCRTGFNWRTGSIEANGQNPHYFEWLRRNGNAVPRNPHDNRCQPEQINDTLFIKIRDLLIRKHYENPLSNNCYVLLGTLLRNASDMQYDIMPRYAIRNRENRNQDLRIDYMLNKLSEEDFKIILQRNEKKHEKYREIHNILDVLKTTVTDIVIRFVDHLEKSRPGKWEDKILNEIEPIVNYANECLFDISKTYKSKCIVFSNALEKV